MQFLIVLIMTTVEVLGVSLIYSEIRNRLS